MESVPGWSQEDYREFWGAVIREFVAELVLMDGWHLSRGCIFEFLVALEASLPVLDERLAPVSLRDGIYQVKIGIREWEQHNVAPEFHHWILDQLQKLETRIARV